MRKSGFLTGWHYAEQGKPINKNPYKLGTLKHRQFDEGYKAFKLLPERGKKCR